jgi:three-Cys-motif partner protein
LIFIEELQRADETLNIARAAQGVTPIEIECLLVFNDLSWDAIDLLKDYVAPLEAKIKDSSPRLHLQVEYINETFESAYFTIKQLLNQGRYPSVLFNLDTSGHIHVEISTLVDIMQSYESPEIFYTFMIESLIAFLRKADPARLQAQLAHLDINGEGLREIEESLMSKQEWLGTAERIVFDASEAARHLSVRSRSTTLRDGATG